MHVPSASPSFKSMLATYRQRLLRDNAPEDSTRRLVVGVLDRWEKHPDVEKLWGKIAKRLPLVTDLVPGILVGMVLWSRTKAETLEELIHELPDREKTTRARLKSLFRNAGQDGQLLCEAALVHDARNIRDRIWSRKTEHAQRQYFMVFWHDAFEELTGYPLDHVVADLTWIAFGGRHIDVDDVRAAVRVAARRIKDRSVQPSNQATERS